MKNSVLKKSAGQRIRGIHRLSASYNHKTGNPHQKRLLELMRHHVIEIEELVAARNKHFLVETGDLAILCFELLLENKVSLDEVLECCFGRYERKLGGLLAEMQGARKLPQRRQNKEGNRRNL